MLFRAVITALLLTLLISLLPVVSEARKDTAVKSHIRKGNTPVQSHKRKSPNISKLDNYGTKGNVNPNTGKVGTKKPYIDNSVRQTHGNH